MGPWFETGINFIILLNTITLACDKADPYPKWFSLTLEILNYIFTAIFCLEAVIKIIGMGVRPYFKEAMNKFDVLIVVSSVVELAFFNQDGGGGVFSSFRAFRMFKIFRLFKMGSC